MENTKKNETMENGKVDNLSIIGTVKALEKVFDKANKEFYNDELTRPVITFDYTPVKVKTKTDKTTGQKYKVEQVTYGHFVCGEVWHGNDLSRCELNIACNNLSDNNGIITTLLHEMAHAYAFAKGIKDTSGSGNTYHNKDFAKIVNEHGLFVDDTMKTTYGYNEAILNDKGKKFAESIKDDLAGLKRDNTQVKKVASKKSQSFKYVCPICGAIARTTKEMNLLCGECSAEDVLIEMILAE